VCLKSTFEKISNPHLAQTSKYLPKYKNRFFFKTFFYESMSCILQVVNLKLKIEKFEIKTESVKTSNSVSGINSDGLTEKSKTSKLIQWEDVFSFFYCFT